LNFVVENSEVIAVFSLQGQAVGDIPRVRFQIVVARKRHHSYFAVEGILFGSGKIIFSAVAEGKKCTSAR